MLHDSHLTRLILISCLLTLCFGICDAQFVYAEAPETSEAADSKPPLAAQPRPRSDKNSKIAHAQLLNKARLGATTARIDLYFVGDSITRRWGCTDPQHAEPRESWKKHFYGWNAANFAWGGDTTSNILWRLQNGELKGLRPKVFVIQAGTNNLSSAPKMSEAEEIFQGIKAIAHSCRKKVPNAKILVTAVFPRNDRPAALPVIRAINNRIADYAEQNNIRFLNVNDALSDEDGLLLKRMTTDGLHLSGAGYEVWAEGLNPILTKWLGPRASEDHAPPPTGDPSVAPVSANTLVD